MGSVDRCSVDGEPLAYLVKTLYLGWWDDSLGVWPDVEKVVPSLAGDVDQVAQQGLGRLEVMVIGLIAPGVVHGHAGFPVTAGIAFRRDVLLGCFGVAFVASTEPVVPDEVGMLVEQGDDFAGQGWRHVRGRSIEPDDDGKIAVVGQQLFHLGDGLGVKVSGKVTILGRVPMMGGKVVAGPSYRPHRRGLSSPDLANSKSRVSCPASGTPRRVRG